MSSCLPTGASTRFWVLEILSVHNEIGTYQRWYAAPGEFESSPFFRGRRERWELLARRLVNMHRNSNEWRRVVELLTCISNTWENVVGGRHAMARIDAMRSGKPVVQTANSRGEKSVTSSSFGLQFYKWWESALNHFRFMIIFITMCFSMHECSDVPAKLHDLPSGNSQLVEGILLTAISP